MTIERDPPWVPTDYSIKIQEAVSAVASGNASPAQQQLAMDWIVKSASEYYELSYYPNPQDTAFAEGKRFVGKQVVKLINMPPQLIAEMRNKQQT